MNSSFSKSSNFNNNFSKSSNSNGSSPRNRNNFRRSNGYSAHGRRRSNMHPQSFENGLQGFQNALSQLNQINQMMMQSKNINPMELFNQFFNTKQN